MCSLLRQTNRQTPQPSAKLYLNPSMFHPQPTTWVLVQFHHSQQYFLLQQAAIQQIGSDEQCSSCTTLSTSSVILAFYVSANYGYTITISKHVCGNRTGNR